MINEQQTTGWKVTICVICFLWGVITGIIISKAIDSNYYSKEVVK